MALILGFFCFRNGTSTVVTSIFGGILQNEVNCLICGTESRKFDPFLGKYFNMIFFFSSCKFVMDFFFTNDNSKINNQVFKITFLDLSLDIPSQFRNKRTKNQESGPICTLRGKDYM